MHFNLIGGFTFIALAILSLVKAIEPSALTYYLILFGLSASHFELYTLKRSKQHETNNQR